MNSKNIKSNHLNNSSLAILMNIVLLIQYIAFFVQFVLSGIANKSNKNTQKAMTPETHEPLLNILLKACRGGVVHRGDMNYCEKLCKSNIHITNLNVKPFLSHPKILPRAYIIVPSNLHNTDI